MIADLKSEKIISELKRSKLPSYWLKYFEYELDVELFNLTNNELIKVILEEKKKVTPFIDSQIIISNILTKFGSKHLFHRQFREHHPDSDSAQLLGMQLYNIIINDTDIWIYCDLKKKGHMFSHATYFK